jgi:MFS superfamily sulfate permease-like transporter
MLFSFIRDLLVANFMIGFFSTIIGVAVGAWLGHFFASKRLLRELEQKKEIDQELEAQKIENHNKKLQEYFIRELWSNYASIAQVITAAIKNQKKLENYNFDKIECMLISNYDTFYLKECYKAGIIFNFVEFDEYKMLRYFETVMSKEAEDDIHQRLSLYLVGNDDYKNQVYDSHLNEIKSIIQQWGDKSAVIIHLFTRLNDEHKVIDIDNFINKYDGKNGTNSKKD